MTYIVVPVKGGGGGATALRGLVPVTDGSAASLNEIGYIETAQVTSLTASGIGATGAWGSVTSVTIPAGVWMLQGIAQVFENDAPLTQVIKIGISSSASGAGIGTFDQTIIAPQLTGAPIQQITPLVKVNIVGSTTYYLNTFFNYASGSPQHAGILWAIRYS